MFATFITLHEWVLLALSLVTVLLPVLGARKGIPFLNLLGRWARWLLFAALFAFFIDRLGLSTRPDWVHFLTGLAVWFLLETGYNWMAIKILSRSDIPLFPDFRENRDGDEWPADENLIGVREFLRKEGYERVKALKATLFEDTSLRASIYEDPEHMIRIQVLFLPKRKGGATACYMISSRDTEGRRMITDNFFLPFGGFYPEGWNLCRKPLIGSLPRLLRLHRIRLTNATFDLAPFEDDPLDDINEQQRILERLNTETGFLVPRPQREEDGKITNEGRYRLWKEMWLLAYLGKSVT